MLTTVIVLCLPFVSLAASSTCTTPTGETGTCVPLSECRSVFNLLQSGTTEAQQLYKKSVCGRPDAAMVCCGPQSPRGAETRLLPSEDVCGFGNGDDRVWGGEITEIWDFPWMALLGYKKSNGEDDGFLCGGSLINERYILTAAHCVQEANSKSALEKVRLGEWRISTKIDCETDLVLPECVDPAIDLQIEEKIVHSEYDSRSGKNDIALLRLSQNVNFTETVRPICLPKKDSMEPVVGKRLAVAGWGATENSSASDYKRKVKIPVVSKTVCNERIKRSGIIGDERICAGGEAGKDTCQGDSGGPLMDFYNINNNVNPRWYLEGIVSRGAGCGFEGFPGVYTRVPVYMEWIINNLA